jgi:hypothetical protein
MVELNGHLEILSESATLMGAFRQGRRSVCPSSAPTGIKADPPARKSGL